MIWIWIAIAALVAVLISLIQYNYLFARTTDKRKPWFAVLRALTVFLILLLFISPKIENNNYKTLKPQLILMADNSSSIKNLNVEEALGIDLEELKNDPELNEKFDVLTYTFDQHISQQDSLNFTGSSTDLSEAILQPQQLYKDRNKAIVLLTDGNQTVGNSFQYLKTDRKTHLYPIVYGDTTKYPDLRISQLNVNRYSYLNNEYPVEVFLNYTGDADVNTVFKITENGNTLFEQAVSFSKSEKSAVLNFNLTSNSVGLHRMLAQIQWITSEKNRENNSRNFAVEVIDQQSKILILSNTFHPDMSALKSAIESNKQRSVEIKKLSDIYAIDDYNLVILYGYNSAFAKANSSINTLGKNTWLIFGTKPDLSFLNATNDAFKVENYPQTDDVQPIINNSYPNFNLELFQYDDYPPVQSPFGQITNDVPIDVLMYKQIGNVETRQPLWFTYEMGTTKHAVFAGSGLWRWRSQNYLNTKDFRNFDDLINSQIQYLASNKKRNRLELDFKTFYYENEKVLIGAQYLNKNYEFMNDGVLNLKLRNSENEEAVIRPLILTNNNYTVDLSGLNAGDYTFTVDAATENLTRSGNFSILEFDIEKQFIYSNPEGLKAVAFDSNLYYPRQIKQLKSVLMKDSLMQDVERKEVTYQSLIDWKILMGFILILLTLEWFLRKYNGLI
ncbi:hypothetical protein [Nonlabens antarcticus]|uniref:hypothetical protein n=1 Tax=Nonlabens antarcticus TaxID=392714 RepID=UPI0018911972|nr:hypothetical protein [Nonlabens antarcticus]